MILFNPAEKTLTHYSVNISQTEATVLNVYLYKNEEIIQFENPFFAYSLDMNQSITVVDRSNFYKYIVSEERFEILLN